MFGMVRMGRGELSALVYLEAHQSLRNERAGTIGGSVTAPLSVLLDRWRPDDLPRAPGRIVVPAPARAITVGGLARRAGGPLLVVVPSEREAEELADDVALFLDDVVYLPPWETLPFEHVSPNASTMARRALARHRLVTGGPGAVIVSSVRSTIQRLSPSSITPIEAREGQEVPFDDLVRRLGTAGYGRTDRVEARGEFAVRGGIIDVFPAQADGAVRVDFWGDTVEDVRAFSIGSQRSVNKIARLVAYPAREFRPDELIRSAARRLITSEPWAAATWERIAEGVHFAGMESWMPWLAADRSLVDEVPSAGVVVVFDPSRARDRAKDLVKEERDLAAALAGTWGDRSPDPQSRPALFL